MKASKLRFSYHSRCLVTICILFFFLAPLRAKSEIVETSLATRIPISELFSHPTLWHSDLSPSGDFISALMIEEGKTYAVIIDASTGEKFKTLRFRHDEKVQSLGWVDNDTLHLSYRRNKKVNHGFIELDSANPSALSHFQRYDVEGYLVHPLPNQENTVLFAKVEGGKYNKRYVLYQVETRELNAAEPNHEPFAHAVMPVESVSDGLLYTYDESADTYFGLTLQKKKNQVTQWYQTGNTGKWQKALTWKEKDYYFKLLAYMGNHQFLVLTNKNTDLIAAARFNAKTQKIEEILYEHDQFDLVSAKLNNSSLNNRTLTSVEYMKAGHRVKEYLANSFYADQVGTAIASNIKQDHFSIIDASTDAKKLLVLAHDSSHSGQFHFFDSSDFNSTFSDLPIKAHNSATKLKHTVLGNLFSYSKPYQFAQTQTISVTTADGDTIEAFYTPATVNRKNVLLVIPHGGPIGIRDNSYFSDTVQFFANRGYSVLKVNFRGSGGYGKRFRDKGVGQFGKRIEQDIKLAFDQVKAKYGYQTACTYGTSYGGYSALMLPILYPDEFSCAIGTFGVYDLSLLFNESNEGVTEQYRESIAQIAGQYSDELVDTSPVYLAEKLNVPVFLIAGENDRIARPEHSNRMHYVLKNAGKSSRFITYQDTGHGHTNLQRQQHQHALVDEFIKQSLGMDTETTADLARQLANGGIQSSDANQKKSVVDELMLLADGYEFDVLAEQDKPLSHQYYQLAASLGESRAMLNVGAEFLIAKQEQKNVDTAMEWFQRASDAGNAIASYKLGQLWYSGENGTIDLQKSYDMFLKAHQQGHHASAGLLVARALCLGKGVAKDVASCVELLSLLAWRSDKVRSFNNEVLQEDFKLRPTIISNILMASDFNAAEQALFFAFLQDELDVGSLPIEFDLRDEGEYRWRYGSLRHTDTHFNIEAAENKVFGLRFSLDTDSKPTDRIAIAFRWKRFNKATQKTETVREGMLYSKDLYGWGVFHTLKEDELYNAEYHLELRSMSQELLIRRTFNVVAE